MYHRGLATAGDQREQQARNLIQAVVVAGNSEPLPMPDPAAEDRNPYPTGLALAKTVRLILSQDKKSLSLGVSTDMSSVFEQSRSTYQPRMGALSLDLGLNTLFGTHQGDLLGRGWLETLYKIDRILTWIARHRQQLGLKVASPHYREEVQRLRGVLKTEINRIFNRLIKTKAPERFILEKLNFKNPNLSRRLNRLLSNFGKGLITAKLKELEVRFGIVSEFRNAAYTSQECHSCGYVAKNNRTKQVFHCKFCHLKMHADVNAPRVLLGRRSCQSLFTAIGVRIRSTLVESTQAFNQRFTRPRGGPADPRWHNPYFQDWAAWVRSSETGEKPVSQVRAA